jgi:hypothetical protein
MEKMKLNKNALDKSSIEKEDKKVRDKLKRYSEYKSVKVNTDRIDFDLQNEHVEDLINQHYEYVDEISTYKFNIF